MARNLSATPAVAGLAALALCGLPAAHAQKGPAYPERPVRMLVGFAPGGGADTAARPVAQRLADVLGQQFVVDNRPGAGGNIATEIAARSTPDGYTLLVGTIAALAINPSIYEKLGFDPVRDFSPITNMASSINVLVVHPSVPAKTVKELIALARSRPGQLNYASAGPGSSQHLAAALLNTLAKVDTVHVPFRGSPPALAGLIAGEIAFMLPTLTSALPHIQNGRLRALAVTGPTRSVELPNVPTVAESLPGFDVVSWWGVVAPANIPRPALDRLNGDLVKTIAMAEVKAGLLKVGMNAASTTPEQFGQYIRDEIAKWTKVARAANIKLE